VLELGANGGYSTLWLLAAQLRTAAAAGVQPATGAVHSFDLADHIDKHNLAQALGTDAATLGKVLTSVTGDAHETLPPRLRDDAGLARFGYIFIDAEHSATFGMWLGKMLAVQAMLQQRRRTRVSVHDILHSRVPEQEGVALLQALPPSGRNATVGTLWHAARCKLGPRRWLALMEARRAALWPENPPPNSILPNAPTVNRHNSMIFFSL